jgi:hypothetical protein
MEARPRAAAPVEEEGARGKGSKMGDRSRIRNWRARLAETMQKGEAGE